MNVVLDATIIIHLRAIGCSRALVDVATLLGWNLILPRIVESEATKRKPLDPELTQAIGKGLITQVSANLATYNRLRGTHGNLGDGELEALAIVSDCIDRTFSEYIVLSEDDTARAHGESMGITFVGILPLLSQANAHYLLSRVQALRYLNRLQKNNFTPSGQYAQDFIDSLQ